MYIELTCGRCASCYTPAVENTGPQDWLFCIHINKSLETLWTKKNILLRNSSTIY